MKKPIVCAACGVEEGELHRAGCSLDYCADCGRQVATCECQRYRPSFFIKYSTFCPKCGAKDPVLFSVANHVWAYYIEPSERDKVICQKCFEYIRAAIDSRQGPPPFGEFEIATGRQLWAAFYETVLQRFQDAGAPDDVVAAIRAEAEVMDRGIAQKTQEEDEGHA